MPRSISRVVLSCGLLALAAAVGGCQRGPTWNLASVEGTITKDGRPLANIQVIFLTDLDAGTQGPRASGITDAAGHYELRTDAGDRGAAIGRYRVCILTPLPTARGRQANRPKENEVEPPASEAVQLPPAYRRFAETPLRVEVRPGQQVIDLEVK
jgi:hypothetical protein